MSRHRVLFFLSLCALALPLSALVGCGSGQSQTTTPTPSGRAYDAFSRLRFNQLAVQQNLPLFWEVDRDGDGAVDPDEVRTLLFYPSQERWTDGGAFTPAFTQAYEAMVEADHAAEPTDPRLRLVHQELSSIAPTLIYSDLREEAEAHRAFARHMLTVAGLIDRIYAQQVGMVGLAEQASGMDTASQSLFRRNWGVECRGTTTQNEEDCSAIAGDPEQPVDVYPAQMQRSATFCRSLEQHGQSEALLTPFTVVREREGELVAVPYSEAYSEPMQAVAAELRAAADALEGANEAPLQRYLRAAAQSFTDNNWDPADEAWAAMNARNSRWYVRVGPDEVYWEPCRQKAGFHLTFARINSGSLEWQERLTPIQADMEAALAALVPEQYQAREVSFHMPDFIDIVLNAGDDRDAMGATIGQSLPNWGPVANEGRGRTVAMSNLYTDPDSLARGREKASSLFSAETMQLYSGDPADGLLDTILHEATHNLGPAHEYQVNGQTDSQAFGGELASMLEELKAQSGALFFLQLLRQRGLITEQQERQAYVGSIAWAFGHISRGMYTPSGRRKAYSQLAAIQVGFLMDQNVITFDPEATAANGEDQGAFTIDFDAFPAATVALMREVMLIKATVDRQRAEQLAARYVDGDRVPQAHIVRRYQRYPSTSFVYAADM